MLRPVVAGQGLGDLAGALLAPLDGARPPSCWGSRSPATIARMMASPVTPVMSVDRLGQLHVHLLQRLLHVLDVRRPMLDQRPPDGAGRPATPRSRLPAGRSRGASPRCAGPGSTGSPGCRSCAPARSSHGGHSPPAPGSPRASRISYTGIQYTPVDSMATVSTPQATSQSAKACRSGVNVPNLRTGVGRALRRHRRPDLFTADVQTRRIAGGSPSDLPSARTCDCLRPMYVTSTPMEDAVAPDPVRSHHSRLLSGVSAQPARCHQ